MRRPGGKKAGLPSPRPRWVTRGVRGEGQSRAQGGKAVHRGPQPRRSRGGPYPALLSPREGHTRRPWCPEQDDARRGGRQAADCHPHAQSPRPSVRSREETSCGSDWVWVSVLALGPRGLVWWAWSRARPGSPTPDTSAMLVPLESGPQQSAEGGGAGGHL